MARLEEEKEKKRRDKQRKVEWGEANKHDNTKGVTFITSGTCRRSPPSTLDNKIHHKNTIQNIPPNIQANLAGAADSIMLDVEGFVAETNNTTQQQIPSC